MPLALDTQAKLLILLFGVRFPVGALMKTYKVTVTKELIDEFYVLADNDNEAAMAADEVAFEDVEGTWGDTVVDVWEDNPESGDPILTPGGWSR